MNHNYHGKFSVVTVHQHHQVESYDQSIVPDGAHQLRGLKGALKKLGGNLGRRTDSESSEDSWINQNSVGAYRHNLELRPVKITFHKSDLNRKPPNFELLFARELAAVLGIRIPRLEITLSNTGTDIVFSVTIHPPKADEAGATSSQEAVEKLTHVPMDGAILHLYARIDFPTDEFPPRVSQMRIVFDRDMAMERDNLQSLFISELACILSINPNRLIITLTRLEYELVFTVTILNAKTVGEVPAEHLVQRLREVPMSGEILHQYSRIEFVGDEHHPRVKKGMLDINGENINGRLSNFRTVNPSQSDPSSGSPAPPRPTTKKPFAGGAVGGSPTWNSTGHVGYGRTFSTPALPTSMPAVWPRHLSDSTDRRPRLPSVTEFPEQLRDFPTPLTKVDLDRIQGVNNATHRRERSTDDPFENRFHNLNLQDCAADRDDSELQNVIFTFKICGKQSTKVSYYTKRLKMNLSNLLGINHLNYSFQVTSDPGGDKVYVCVNLPKDTVRMLRNEPEAELLKYLGCSRITFPYEAGTSGHQSGYTQAAGGSDAYESSSARYQPPSHQQGQYFSHAELKITFENITSRSDLLELQQKVKDQLVICMGIVSSRVNIRISVSNPVLKMVEFTATILPPTDKTSQEVIKAILAGISAGKIRQLKGLKPKISSPSENEIDITFDDHDVRPKINARCELETVLKAGFRQYVADNRLSLNFEDIPTTNKTLYRVKIASVLSPQECIDKMAQRKVKSLGTNLQHAKIEYYYDGTRRLMFGEREVHEIKHLVEYNDDLYALPEHKQGPQKYVVFY